MTFKVVSHNPDVQQTPRAGAVNLVEEIPGTLVQILVDFLIEPPISDTRTLGHDSVEHKNFAQQYLGTLDAGIAHFSPFKSPMYIREVVRRHKEPSKPTYGEITMHIRASMQDAMLYGDDLNELIQERERQFHYFSQLLWDLDMYAHTAFGFKQSVRLKVVSVHPIPNWLREACGSQIKIFQRR